MWKKVKITAPYWTFRTHFADIPLIMRDFNVGKKVAHTKEQNCKGETANSLNSLFVFLVSERQVEVLLTSASRGVLGGGNANDSKGNVVVFTYFCFMIFTCCVYDNITPCWFNLENLNNKLYNNIRNPQICSKFSCIRNKFRRRFIFLQKQSWNFIGHPST